VVGVVGIVGALPPVVGAVAFVFDFR